MEEKILKTLRAQAWERAKGELKSVLQTYWDGYGKDENYRKMDELVSELIAEVENEGLVE